MAYKPFLMEMTKMLLFYRNYAAFSSVIESPAGLLRKHKPCAINQVMSFFVSFPQSYLHFVRFC